jgi:hypothetical protein
MFLIVPSIIQTESLAETLLAFAQPLRDKSRRRDRIVDSFIEIP